MTKPYDFVPFLRCEGYNEKGDLEGRIPIKVKTLTPVHISSGRYRIQDNKNVYKEFVKVNGRIVIPGTSFKGCIRTIAESVSYSCLQTALRDGSKLPANKSHVGGQKCIICDMFGTMGSKSKVRFSDLKAIEYRTEIRGIPKSFRPHPDNSFYIENGKYKGYKFYKHGINGIQLTGPVLCEFVGVGAEFEGEVMFKGLTIEQLRLLCFSLGLSGDIHPKIGYGKSYFYGSIEVSSQSEWAKFAREYIDTCSDDIRQNINVLISVLNYKNALRSYD